MTFRNGRSHHYLPDKEDKLLNNYESRGQRGSSEPAQPALAPRPAAFSHARPYTPRTSARSDTNMAGEVRKFTRKEVADSNKKETNTFIIDNQVYDVAKFLDEHPGGHEVLMNVAGKDATEDFEDIGHSLDAKDLMKKFRIGEIVDEEKVENKRARSSTWTAPAAAATAPEPSFVSSWKFPVVLGILVTVLYTYLFG